MEGVDMTVVRVKEERGRLQLLKESDRRCAADGASAGGWIVRIISNAILPCQNNNQIRKPRS